MAANDHKTDTRDGDLGGGRDRNPLDRPRARALPARSAGLAYRYDHRIDLDNRLDLDAIDRATGDDHTVAVACRIDGRGDVYLDGIDPNGHRHAATDPIGNLDADRGRSDRAARIDRLIADLDAGRIRS